MILNSLYKIEVYTDEFKQPVLPKIAKVRYVTIFKENEVGIKKQYQEYSENGWEKHSNKSIIRYYKAVEEFREEDHPRDHGKFTTKGGGSKDDFKEKLKSKIKPDSKVRAIQEEVDKEITGKVWNTIDELGIRDKIKDVAMQGSYEKGTDLPTSGSDLDIFVVFNTDVPKDEREKLGVEIGMKSLDGKNPYIQDATSKYAEARWTHKGQDMEVQIVPTRHLTLDQIKNKEVDGKKIDIGMERTPHQTAFMKKALKGKEEEVRILKQFMKDTGLYDSSMKSQGFSGYSTEVLIHNLGSFENVMKFFADFKVGKVVGGLIIASEICFFEYFIFIEYNFADLNNLSTCSGNLKIAEPSLVL